MSAFDLIRAWAVETIEGVDGFNKAYGTVRIIQNDQQMEEDFGTGVTPTGELQQRTHGWMVSIRSRPEAEEFNNYQALQGYVLQATCYSSVYDRGASEAAFNNHALEVANALHGELVPDIELEDDEAFSFYDVSPVAIDFEVVEFSLTGGRLHHRATLNFTVRTTETARSE